MAANDKPTVHATLSALDADGKPEPFVYMTRANKRVIFPDPLDMDAFEGEAFLAKMQTAPNSQALAEWLSAKDFEALKAEKLTLRQLGNLMQKINEHYQGVFGSEGEGDASTPS